MRFPLQFILLSFFFMLSLTQASAQAPLPLKELPPLRPLMVVYNLELEDYLYSIDNAVIQDAIAHMGYDDYPSAEGFGVVGYLEPTQQTNTKAFQPTGPINDGFIYTLPVPGTKPLYRLEKTVLSQRVDYYTLLHSEIHDMQAQGFNLKELVGYMYASVTPNFAPTVYDGVVLGRRCHTPVYYCGGTTYRDYYFNQHFNKRSIYKPGSSPTLHQVTFTLLTWDGLSRSMGHMAIMMRNHIQFNPANLLTTRFEGVGVIIGAYGCPGNTNGNRATVELWRPDTGTNGQAYVDCRFLSPELFNGVKYDFVIKSFNNGDMYYSIRIHEDQTLVHEAMYNVKNEFEQMGGTFRAFPQPKPNDKITNMNYSVLHANDSKFDLTVYFENLRSIWVQ